MENERKMSWLGMLLALCLAACSQSAPAPAGPLEFDKTTQCSLDGMSLADYPGPKGQIQYADGKPEFFCDTVEVISALLQPEQKRVVTAAYVNDMGKVEWETPRGGWIDARTALYVKGSRKHGAMGPTLVPFSDEAAARAFMQREGGQLLHFKDIAADSVALDGGALHDTNTH